MQDFLRINISLLCTLLAFDSITTGAAYSSHSNTILMSNSEDSMLWVHLLLTSPPPPFSHIPYPHMSVGISEPDYSPSINVPLLTFSVSPRVDKATADIDVPIHLSVVLVGNSSPWVRMFYDGGVENGLLNDNLLNVLRIKATFRE